MQIFKIANEDYTRVRQVFDGWAFQRPLGDAHHAIKFTTKKAQKQILEVLEKNGIKYEDTGTNE
jgi:phosphoketolase